MDPIRYQRVVPAMMCAVALAGLLAACGKAPERVEEVRPVRVIVVEPEKVSVIAEFSGEVRARVESRPGFRVPGKIIARKVEVGTRVKRGQLLMQLDPQDLKLAQQQADAALSAAQGNLAFAKSELDRYRNLHQKNFVSAAVLEAKETAFRSAQASHQQAIAAARNQSNQADYASLLADADGVVTAVDAEVGQVVAAGTPVLRVAREGDKEVVIGIPEDRVDALRSVTDLQVGFWADRTHKVAGKLRELSPVADPGTRTYLARVSIPDAPEQIRLGMTASVAFIAARPNPALKLPLTALLNDRGQTAVWIVEDGAVRLVPIQLSTISGNEVVVASGLSAGQTVVTAGVNSLKPGQKVKLLAAEPATAKSAEAAAKPSASGAAK